MSYLNANCQVKYSTISVKKIYLSTGINKSTKCLIKQRKDETPIEQTLIYLLIIRFTTYKLTAYTSWLNDCKLLLEIHHLSKLHFIKMRILKQIQKFNTQIGVKQWKPTFVFQNYYIRSAIIASFYKNMSQKQQKLPYTNQCVSKTSGQQEASNSFKKSTHKSQKYAGPKLKLNKHAEVQIQMKQLQNIKDKPQNIQVSSLKNQALDSQRSDRKLVQNTFCIRKSLEQQTQQAQIHQTQQQNEQDSFQDDINELAHQLTKYAESQADYNYDICLIGLWIGCIICIIVFMLALIIIHDLSIENNTQFSRDFPVWRGLAIFIFYIWMLAFDLFVFKKYKINIKQLFDLQDQFHPKSIDLMKLAGFLTSVYLIFFMMYLLDITDLYNAPNFAQEYFALVCWACLALSICAPIPTLYREGRYFVFRLLIRTILCPFRGVTFASLMLTNQIGSMALPLRDLSYTVCFYTQLNLQSNDSQICEDGNKASVVLATALVANFMGILQCIRQGSNQQYLDISSKQIRKVLK